MTDKPEIIIRDGANIDPLGSVTEKPNEKIDYKATLKQSLPKLAMLLILILTLVTVYLALTLLSKKSQDSASKNRPVKAQVDKISPTPLAQSEDEKEVNEFSNIFNSTGQYNEKLQPPTVNLKISFK